MARNKQTGSEEFELSTYSKSNRIINAKGKSTALGLKLFAVGIREARKNKDGTITATVSGTQLRKLFGNNNGSFYTQIKDLIKPEDEAKPSILDWRIYIQNDETEKIEGINVVNDAKFENGELSLTFNRKIENDIYGLRDNYARLSLQTTIDLQSPYSIRLYEIFKAFMDRERAVTKNPGPYYMTYQYDDFKQLLGLLNPAVDTGSARKTRKKEMFPDYTHFRRGVLDKAQKELNAISTVHMEYEPIRTGRGAKVTALKFILTRQEGSGRDSQEQNKSGERVIDTSSREMTDEKFAVISRVSGMFMKLGLSLIDIKAVCDAAEYNEDKLRSAYELGCVAKNVDNMTGWLIAAIRGDYKPSGKAGSSAAASDSADVPAAHSGAGQNSAGKKSARIRSRNEFNNFQQNQYDFDDLESRLINS